MRALHLLWLLVAAISPVFSQPGADNRLPALNASSSEGLIIIFKEPSLSKTLREARAKKMSDAELKKLCDDVSARHLQLRKRVAQDLSGIGAIRGVKKEFRYLLNGMAVDANITDMLAIKKHPEVDSVWPDTIMTAHLDESINHVGAPDVWNLRDDMDRNLRGQGTVVAILDSGVDYNHPDLGGGFGPGFRVINGYDFIDNDPDPMDSNGHGTHVAGIAAANGGLVGVAPEASIFAVRVLGTNGSGATSGIVAGIEWAVDPDGDPLTDDGADVINMSLGGPGSAFSPSALASDEAHENGVVVIVSAGNSGDARGAMGSPAMSQKGLAVAASFGRSSIAGFSSRGPGEPLAVKPEISAPGVAIDSAAIGGGTAQQQGTSMAAPHVAGAAALLLQKYPNWEPEQVIQRLIHTSVILDNYEAREQGAGVMNLPNAFSAELRFNQRGILFDRVDLAQDTFVSEASLSIENISGASRDISFNTVAELPAGASMSIEPATITLAAGETGSVTLRMTVDNTTAEFPDNFGMIWNGMVVAESNGKSYPTPFSMRKSVRLLLDFKDEGFYSYHIFNNSQAPGQTFPTSVSGTESNIDLLPGSYTVFGMGFNDSSEETDGLEMYFFAQESMEIGENDTTRELPASGASLEVRHEVTGQDGVRRSVKDLEHQSLIAVIRHKSSELSYGESFTPFSGSFKAYPMSDNIELEGFGLGWNSATELFELGFHLEGLEGNTTVHQDAADMKAFQVKTPLYGSGSSSTIFVATSLAGQIFFPWTRGESLSGPLDITYLAVPQGPAAQSEGDRVTYRRINVNVMENILATPVFRVLTNEEWSQYEVQGSVNRFFSPINTRTDSAINIGYGPFLPQIRFENSDNEVHFNELSDVFDPFGSQPNGLKDGAGNALLVNPSQLIAETRVVDESLNKDLPGMPNIDPPEGGGTIRHSLQMPGILNGQYVIGEFEALFDLSREDRNPPALVSITMEENGAPVQNVSANTRLRAEFEDDEGVSNILLEVRAEGGDWTALTAPRIGNSMRANLPDHAPGTMLDIRVSAEDASGNSVSFVHEQAGRYGSARVIPWVVNNSQWESRIALFNNDSVDAEVRFTAVPVSGDRVEITATVPAGGVSAWSAAEMFGELSGYSLEMDGVTDHLYASFLTFNIEAQSGGNSPSQTTGQPIAGLTQALHFPYLPGDQIPAIVLCAPESRGEVAVTLTLSTPGDSAQTTVVLEGDRPQAFLVNDLFDRNVPEDAVLTAFAERNTKIGGTVFAFNQTREPSMTSGLVNLLNQSKRQIIPWVVENDAWLSRIAIVNRGAFDGLVRFSATTREGDLHVTELELASGEHYVTSAGKLFPDVTGYTLDMEVLPFNGREADIASSFLTFNTQAESGGFSPSQTSAAQEDDLASELIFAYVPNDQIPALVLSTPDSDGDDTVTLSLYGTGGDPIATTEIVLAGKRPTAALISSLFDGVSLPRDAAVVARAADGTLLAGTLFTFNGQREPSMAKPFAVK